MFVRNISRLITHYTALHPKWLLFQESAGIMPLFRTRQLVTGSTCSYPPIAALLQFDFT
jgi:hypothetical protein